MVALSLPDPEAARRHVTVIEPMIGGGGGRPGRDGVDGCEASLGFLQTTPAETLEAEVPIVVRRFHLVPDSAGPGRFRGGFAVRLDFQVFRPEGLVTARGMERLRFAPWGVGGGTAGSTGSVMLNPGTAGERPLAKIDVLALEPGDVLSVRTPGGGGHGDRFQRPPADVLADVVAGLVSPAHARDAYGVAVAGDRVDEAATAALRTARRGDIADASFDFGPARREHERRWPTALQDQFIALLMSLPAPYRAYVRRTLYPRVDSLAAQRPVTPDDLQRLWQDLRGAIGLR
jgi:N-methylhydantoinase B